MMTMSGSLASSDASEGGNGVKPKDRTAAALQGSVKGKTFHLGPL